MLDKDIINQLKGIFADFATPVTLVVSGVAENEATREMIEFAEDFASASEALSMKTQYLDTLEGAPVLSILKEDKPTGISFCGIPNGHEFTSLILAVLNVAGLGKNLPDETLSKRIKALKGPVKTSVFVSLSCTNCPEVVQSLNIIALLNPEYSNMMVDGAQAPEMVSKYNIQSVPTVYVGDRMISAGRASLGELVSKLEEIFGSQTTDEGDAGGAKEYDAVVAGGGPAGASAAIYLARKGLRTAVVAGRIGGQVKDTMEIENLISVPLTTGPELASDLRTHLMEYDVDIFDNRQIISSDIVGSIKKIETDGGEIFISPVLVIATGASWRKLNIPGEDEYIGRGVAFCTHCDGPFYAGKRVAVVGGGNSGVEAAIELAGICTHVDLFEFLDELKADEVLQRRLADLPTVDVHLSTALVGIEGDGSNVTGIKARNRKTGEESSYDVQGVFVQIGLTPNSDIFAGQISVNDRNEIITDRSGRTSATGVYAAGDVTDVPYKQIVIAMGEGASAALSAVEDRMRGVV